MITLIFTENSTTIASSSQTPYSLEVSYTLPPGLLIKYPELDFS